MCQTQLDTAVLGLTPLEQDARDSFVRENVKHAIAQVWSSFDEHIQHVEETMAREEPARPKTTWQYSSPHQRRLVRVPSKIPSSPSLHEIAVKSGKERANAFFDAISPQKSPVASVGGPSRFADRYQAVGSPCSKLGCLSLPNAHLSEQF